MFTEIYIEAVDEEFADQVWEALNLGGLSDREVLAESSNSKRLADANANTSTRPPDMQCMFLEGTEKKYCNTGDEELVALATGNFEIAEISTYGTTTE